MSEPKPVEEIIYVLQLLPDQIYEAKVNAKNFSEIELIRTRISEIEAETLFMANAEKDKDGKPKYSNETMRKARLIELLKNDEKYQELRQKEFKIEKEKQMADFEVGRLEDVFSATKHQADLLANSLLAKAIGDLKAEILKLLFERKE